jgi:hypothetical protein
MFSSDLSTKDRLFLQKIRLMAMKLSADFMAVHFFQPEGLYVFSAVEPLSSRGLEALAFSLPME